LYEKPVLQAENLTRRYKSSGRGIERVSLSVAPGEIHGLMGPNGSGKSTLLRILSTAIIPESGSFTVNGELRTRGIRGIIGIMVDRPTHYGDLTGWANAYLFVRAYGVAEKKAEAVLGELFGYFGLSEYAGDRAKTYSYGMGKKLALIQAMAHGPRLLLLDEPSLGLDYTSQLAYRRKIRGLAESGTAIVVASNQVDEVENLCHRVSFMKRGRIVRQGSPRELISDLEGIVRIVATLRHPVDYTPVAEVESVRQVSTEGSELVIHCEQSPGVVEEVVGGISRAGGDVVNLSVRRPNLEDVYVRLTGEGLKDEA
jgi:ABC-type multidrug transport system ATPase subunit